MIEQRQSINLSVLLLIYCNIRTMYSIKVLCVYGLVSLSYVSVYNHQSSIYLSIRRPLSIAIYYTAVLFVYIKTRYWKADLKDIQAGKDSLENLFRTLHPFMIFCNITVAVKVSYPSDKLIIHEQVQQGKHAVNSCKKLPETLQLQKRLNWAQIHLNRAYFRG